MESSIIRDMKKRNFVALQFIFAAILITMGALMAWRGVDITKGVPHLLFTIPGATILFGIFLECFKLKMHIYYVICYFVLYLILDIVSVIYFKLPMTMTVIGLMIGLMILSVLITSVFHFIYDNLRHPDRLIRL